MSHATALEAGGPLWTRTTRFLLLLSLIGLGLAVARLLAEAMSGSLDYERITGRTSFVLSLPLAIAAQDASDRDEILVPTTG